MLPYYYLLEIVWPPFEGRDKKRVARDNIENLITALIYDGKQNVS